MVPDEDNRPRKMHRKLRGRMFGILFDSLLHILLLNAATTNSNIDRMVRRGSVDLLGLLSFNKY